MKKSPYHLVIIAGGSGTRFWPKSTSKRPKQLLSFGGKSSLLAQTVSRFDQIVPTTQRMIVTTQTLKEAVLSENLEVEVLAEPQARNTAPCVYWAARHIAAQNPQAVMLVMPADHYIAYPERFAATVQSASEWALKNDDLVTLGVQPTRPETGYGYLKTSESLDSAKKVRKVQAFVEKPNLTKAEEFLKSGNYLWNGGMFLWRAEVILKAFDQLMPEMKKAWEDSDGDIEKAYPKMTATSIDYGIMEKSHNVVTFQLDCGWDDLGSWTSLDSLADSLKTRVGENVVTGGELLSIDSTGNIVDAQNRLIALLGVENLIVVEQGDSLMIAHKSRAQDIRQVVEQVKKTRPDLI